MSHKLSQFSSMSPPNEHFDPRKEFRRKRLPYAERAERLHNLATNNDVTTPNVCSTGYVSAFTNTAYHTPIDPTSNNTELKSTRSIESEKAEPTISAGSHEFDIESERVRRGVELSHEKGVEDAEGNSHVGFKGSSLKTRSKPIWKEEAQADLDSFYAAKGLKRGANGRYNPYQHPNTSAEGSPNEKIVSNPVHETVTDNIVPLVMDTEVEQPVMSPQVEQPVMSPQVEESGSRQQAVAAAEQKKVGVAKWKILFRKKLYPESTTVPVSPVAPAVPTVPVSPVVPVVPTVPVVLPSQSNLVVKSKKWQFKATMQKWFRFGKNPAGLTCLEQASAEDSEKLRQKERRKEKKREKKRKRKAAKKLKSSKPAEETVPAIDVTTTGATGAAAATTTAAAGNSGNDTDLNPNGAHLNPTEHEPAGSDPTTEVKPCVGWNTYTDPKPSGAGPNPTEHEAVGSDSNMASKPCVGWNPYTDPRPSTPTEPEDGNLHSGGTAGTAAAAAAVRPGPDKPVRKWNLFKRFFNWIKSKNKDTGATTPSVTDTNT
ncbi:hypothetical protein I9W82_000444 [Candida metapsilosis]|uniref:Uncharacterized protein n=1 Tax=Candida metapsilosis TaxID=273372 RepID=A0A8H8DD06_9ASCO|nr:hypothetical protein I9W82_000444 [Candida metapsilosis]